MSKDQYYKRLESLFSSSDSVSPEPVNGKTAPAESELAGLRARIAEMEAALAESQRQAAAWQNQLAEARQQAMANQHSDSLRQAETATSINRIAELETALADALKQIRESQQIESQHRAETTALNNRIADLDHMLESARQQMSANEETTALQRAEAATLRDRAAQLEMALADVRQQTPEQQPAESAALKNQIAELEATLAEARQEAAANRQAHTEQHAAVITLNNRVAELEVALNRAQSRPLPSTGRLADGAATLGKVADNIAGMLYQFVLRRDGSAYFPYISSWCYEKFGVTPEEVRENAAPLVAHVHPDDLPNFQASIAHSAQTMQPWLWEGRGVLKDGNVAHMRSNGNPEKMPNGDTLWNGVLVDVTDTKRAAELEETKNFLETLIEVMPVGLFMKDAQDLRFVRWNKGNEDLIGLSRDHVVGKTDFDFFPREEAEFFQNKDREVLAGGRLVDIPEEPAQTSHRGLRYLHTRKIPVYDAHGQPKYLLGVSEDITERKQAEATLRISEERFSKAFAGVPVAMSINRMSDVRFMEINDRFTAMLGWTPEEAIGRIGSDLKLWVNPEDRVRMYEILHRDSRVRDFPTRFQTKTGEIRDILFSGEIFEAGGEQYLLAMLADVTDRQYFESTLAQRATELEDTTSFLDSVIENLPVMLFVKDAQELSFVRWNKAGEEITGYSKEAFMGKTDHDFFPKEEADFFAKKDREVLGGGQLVDIPEEPIQTAHRGLRYLHTRKIPIYDADGKPKFLLGISEDITERKQAEEELRKFQHALDRSTDAVFMTDPQGKILYVNPAFEKTYGFTAEEAIGQTPRIIKSGLIPQEQYAQFWNALLNKQVVAGEIVNKAKDGRLIPVEGANTSILDSAGNIIGFMATHRDITERKQAEETLAKRAAELEEARNSLDAVIESLPIMLFMKDAEDLRMVRWNKAGADTIGLPAEALVGKTDYDFFPKEEAEFFRAKDREVLENGKLLDIPEEPIQTTHRGLRYLHTRKVPIYGADGKPKFLLGISEDITERKLSEEILAKRAHEMAAVAQVSTDAASVLDPNELLQKVVDLTKISFNLYHAHIYLLNEAEGVLVLTAGAGAIGRRMVADGRRIPIAQAQSLVARAARTRKSVMVNEVTQDPGFLPHPLLPNTRSEMAIPMIVGNRALGVLDVQSDIVDRFTNEDTQIQTTLAAQIAVALQNARQYDQTQAAFKELETLNRRLTRESWRDYVSAQQTSRLGYTYDLNQIKRIENGETVIEGNGAAIEHALTIHGETIGRLAIAEAEQVNADAAEIVAAVAEQLSAHLENLRLTEQAEAARHTSELQAANLARLAQIANTLSQAKTDEEILLAAVNAADKANLLAVTLCYIEGLEGGRPASTRVMAMWAGDDIVKDSPFLNQVFDLRQYASSENWIKNPHDALLVEDLLNNPEVDDQTRALFSRGGGGSMATVPLFSGGAWQGILFFTWAGPREFTPEDHFLLPAINEPVAAAVAARRAYIAEEAARRQSEQRATELEAIAKVSAAAASILDSNLLLQTVVDLTKADLDLYHAHIYILDEPGNSLQLAAGADEVGRKMAAASFAIPVSRPHSLVARAARTRKGVIANDVLEEPDFLPNPYLPNTRSELAVPMIVGDKLIGVFDVQADTVNRFTEADIVLKTTLAEQVAVALQNTRLFAEQASTLERLRELDQLKSSFLANMSHELRTPLNSILGFAQVMIEGIDGEITTQMENDLQVIQKNGQHLLNLISDILDMAKIEAGKMSLNTEIFDLREVMEEVVEITNPMARAKSISVALNASVQQTLDIYADRMRLRQVMINIVNNAIKFTERGYIDISATREGSVIRVMVRDTGIGVLPSHLNKIFEEFSQVDASSTRKAGGTGLGLPISRHLVELHGGKLWAESTGVPGEGATFIIELPVETTYVN